MGVCYVCGCILLSGRCHHKLSTLHMLPVLGSLHLVLIGHRFAMCACKLPCHCAGLPVVCLCHRVLKFCTVSLSHCIAPGSLCITENVCCALRRVEKCCTLWSAPILSTHTAACGLQTKPGSQHLLVAVSLLLLPCQLAMLYLCSADASANNSIAFPHSEVWPVWCYW